MINKPLHQFKTICMSKRFWRRAIFVLIVFMITPMRWYGAFQPLPPDVAFGLFSRNAIEEQHWFLADSIENLTESASLVARVEIISEQDIALGSGDTERHIHLYSLYNLRVLEVYYGSTAEGDVVQLLQLKALQGSPPWIMLLSWISPDNDGRNIDYIRLPFLVGDDLILFMTRTGDNPMQRMPGGVSGGLDGNRPFFSPKSAIMHLEPFDQNRFLSGLYYLVNPVQGAYRYIPTGDVGDYIREFPSVNRHNKLTLTETDV